MVGAEWNAALELLGAMAPSIAAVRQRGQMLDASEFVEVANELVSIAAVHLLQEDAPPVGVFCLDANYLAQD
tara:strand:- start:23 stop:238 length:216 start_codon:yes stop_codon:yes gene_type:complete